MPCISFAMLKIDDRRMRREFKYNLKYPIQTNERHLTIDFLVKLKCNMQLINNKMQAKVPIFLNFES